MSARNGLGLILLAVVIAAGQPPVSEGLAGGSGEEGIYRTQLVDDRHQPAGPSSGAIDWDGEAGDPPFANAIAEAGSSAPDAGTGAFRGGVDSHVHAVAVGPSGELFLAGEFSRAGEHSTLRVAARAADDWRRLRTGTDDFVHALAADADGNLYAGGGFQVAGGRSASRIARWDGDVWDGLGSGADGFVRAVAVDPSGGVVIGGEFTRAGDTQANYIARWDGQAWTALGSGTDGPVSALAFDEDGNLYAAGEFARAGDVEAGHVAVWDGTSWSPLGGGVDGWARALAVDPEGNVYAGGGFSTAGGESAHHVARWDGSRWHALDTGTNNYVFALASDAEGRIYAGGRFSEAGATRADGIAVWDGQAWAPLGAGVDGTVFAIAVGVSGGVFAGGDFVAAGDAEAGRVGYWAAGTWHDEVDHPPMFETEPVTSARPREEYVYEVLASDPGDDPVELHAETLPEWLSLSADDAGTGLLSGTPGTKDVGDHDISLLASDGEFVVEQGFTVTVAAGLGTDEGPVAFALKGAFPNPSAGSVTVLVDLPHAADVSLDVFDVLGRRVMSVDHGLTDPGAERPLALDATTLSSGVYTYRLRAVGEGSTDVATGRLTIVR